MNKLNTENPFIDLLHDIKMGTKTSVYAKGEVVSVVDDDTGEIKGKGFNAVVRERQYDSERFVKLYSNGREVLPKLSATATKVLWFFVDNMGYDDVVTLNMVKAKEMTGYKNSSIIYRAISELKKHDILANAYRSGVYYINPTMFYRGNRLKLIRS